MSNREQMGIIEQELVRFGKDRRLKLSIRAIELCWGAAKELGYESVARMTKVQLGEVVSEAVDAARGLNL